MKAALAWLKATHGYGVWRRYGDARGKVLAGGIAYFAFFSIFPALTLGFAIFGFVLRGRPDLYHDVVTSVSNNLPGIVKDSAHPNGILDLSTPPTSGVLTLTGVISLVVLLFAGLGFLGALREGVRVMFGLPVLRPNVVFRYLRDIGVLTLLGLAMLVSAALSGVVNTAATQVLDWLGFASDSVAWQIVLPIVGFLVVLVVDVGIYVVVLRLLSGIRIPWSDLREAALLGAFGAGVLKVAVAYGIVGTSSNPLLASIAVVVGLLIVMNLLSRLTLLVAAWAAVGWERSTTRVAEEVAAVEAVAAARRLPHPAEMEPAFGVRSADRTAIAAGAVMGAVGAVGVGALRRATSAMVDLVRHRD